MSLEIDLIGYQFPEVENEAWVSDWLMVRLTLRCGEWEWSKVDPALTTFEVQSCIDWLNEVADIIGTFARWKNFNRLSTREFFTEPNLGFEVFSGHPTGLPATFRIYFWAEFLPADPRTFGLQNVQPGELEPWIDFGVDESKLRQIVESFREQLESYPVRVGL